MGSVAPDMWSIPVYVCAFAISVWAVYVYGISISIRAALHSWHDGQPRLNLRGTILIGKRLQPSNLDFFGGTVITFSLLFDCFPIP